MLRRAAPAQAARAGRQHYLRLVGLGDALHKKPSELSAGMRQRVGIARAFALQPKVLLLDEPFGMLDSLTRFELQQVLLDLWAQDRKTALMVTHDVDEALFLSDRVAMMTSGPARPAGRHPRGALRPPARPRRGHGAPALLRAARGADRLPQQPATRAGPEREKEESAAPGARNSEGSPYLLASGQ